MRLQRRTVLGAALLQAIPRVQAQTRRSDPPTSPRAERSPIVSLVDGELATARNLRTGIAYGPTQVGVRRNIQQAIVEARDGDTIQISPGAIWWPENGDGSNYLEGGMLHVWKSLTITNVPGKSPWRLAPAAIGYVDGWSGIVIREPNQTYSNAGDTERANPRKTIVIEGFEFDNWGRRGGDFGVRIRSIGGAKSWDGVHTSITLRNFSIGKRRFDESASGIGGSAETLVIENGHVFDTGAGIGAGEGQDHNFYIGARRLTMRGVRGSRTRGLATRPMDGHIAKISAVNALIEGCVFDCGPLGDSSYNIQFRAGGNVTLRGCLLIGGAGTQNRSTGVVGYENEVVQTPWYYGAEGHSVLIEKNVFVNHCAKPLVYFRPAGHAWQVQGLSSVAVRDNIGMCAAASGFGESAWIRNDPTNGPAWAANNSVMPYGPDEPGFDGKAQLAYKRSAGPIRASGIVATYRFVWPHGFTARADDFRGLG